MRRNYDPRNKKQDSKKTNREHDPWEELRELQMMTKRLSLLVKLKAMIDSGCMTIVSEKALKALIINAVYPREHPLISRRGRLEPSWSTQILGLTPEDLDQIRAETDYIELITESWPKPLTERKRREYLDAFRKHREAHDLPKRSHDEYGR